MCESYHFCIREGLVNDFGGNPRVGFEMEKAGRIWKLEWSPVSLSQPRLRHVGCMRFTCMFSGMIILSLNLYIHTNLFLW